MTTNEHKLKILAVDDNKTNLHILQVFLKKQGHTVITGENGEEAVRLFNDTQPDIVLLDIMMPVMNGFEAARHIKAACQDRWVPLLFLSALNRDENLLEGLESGADDYITKPINFVVLEAKLRTIRRSLDLQRQARDALRRVETISNNVLDAIITLREDGQIVTVNQACSKLFGLQSDALIGRSIEELLPAAVRAQNGGPTAFLGTPEQIRSGAIRELTLVRQDGRSFPATVGISEVTLDEQHMFIGVVRDISESKKAEEKLRDNARLLQAYFDQTQVEQQLALKLMEKQLHRPSLRDPNLHYKVIAAEHFSGDAVGAQRGPNNELYVMLADATGHGLTAAISVLPLLAIFYRMARTGRQLGEMISELNQQLKESMPIGRFVAATLLCIHPEQKTGEIWIGGTPDVFLVDRWGRQSHVFKSDNLALGILNNTELSSTPLTFSWSPESQLLLCSDGLIEAENTQGQQFGLEGILQAVANTSPSTRFRSIERALTQHIGKGPAADDVSLMLIDCH